MKERFFIWLRCKFLGGCTVDEWQLGMPIRIGNGYWSYYGHCQNCKEPMRTFFNRSEHETGVWSREYPGQHEDRSAK